MKNIYNGIIAIIIMLFSPTFILFDLFIKIKQISDLSYYLFYIIIVVYIISSFVKYVESNEKIKENLLDLFLIFLTLIILLINYSFSGILAKYVKSIIVLLIFFRNLIYLIINIKSGSKQKLNNIAQTIVYTPIRSIITSYLVIILIGAMLLMLPFSSSDKISVGFINALFTSTSAVCVTGLTVVDTATKYSFTGQFIIMILIQIGGLGIMFFAYFSSVIIGRKTSLENKMSASFLLNEDDMSRLFWNIKWILIITFSIEFIGALFLFIGFIKQLGFSNKNLFFSIFHSVSAFCNAGFSLYSNNLEYYVSNFIVSITVCFLIITGGLSFFVHLNFLGVIKDFILRKFFRKNIPFRSISLNTIIVLVVTLILLIGGTLLIYIFEHDNILKGYDVKTQYLASFFQSVTTRTAGFNTIPFGNLHLYTYLIMILWMYIGGASGSTAGGIKVNTVGVIWAYILSVIKKNKSTVLFKKSIPDSIVLNSFLIALLALAGIFVSTLLLTMSEKFRFVELLFEVTSAFGTVGLSAGITSNLTQFGKFIITLMMFFGKISPFSVLIGIVDSQKKGSYYINFPKDKIYIG